MSKKQVAFVCQECGYDTPKFMGKCPECGQWNSLKEIFLQKNTSKSMISKGGNEAAPIALFSIQTKKTSRINTGFSELDNVLGGGIVPGAVMLLAGDPGVGKSTLLLQLSLLLSNKNEVLYVSGEESVEQVKMRSERLSDKGSQDGFRLLSQTNIDQITGHIENLKPSLVVVDSIQTMESENVAGLSGSVAQIRYSTLSLVKIAKKYNISILIVGHVTKEGMVAGPMLLSHMVDTVLFLEGEKFSQIRIIRSLKNRFGPVDEVGVFSMEESGLRQMSDPSQLFLSEHKDSAIGSVLSITMEGTRAFLVEVQALVISSKLPFPKRVVSGIDQKRVELLLAVLQKYCKIGLDTADVFINIAGGVRISDPAIDLGVCLAVFGSMKNLSLQKVVGIGEVGLLGEIRKVPSLKKRIREAERFGYENVVSSEKYKSIRDVIFALDK